MELYSEKAEIYFSNTRSDLIKLLPINANSKILEIGSGGGDTLVEIKRRGLAAEVVGVELFSMPNTKQTDPAIDSFFICDIEKDFPQLQKEYFDVIICGDVLEHLLDPWSIVEELVKHLKPNGLIIASLPNFRFRSALFKVFFKGDFSYTKDGIFDKTHFRFFCKKNIVELFTSRELSVQSIYPNFKFSDKAKRARFLNLFSLGVFEEFLALQFLVVAKKRVI